MSTESEVVMVTPPSVSWAQRSALVFLTINVECDKPEIKIDNKGVYFKGVCLPDQKIHEVEIPLYSEIDPERSVHCNKGRFIDVVLTKKTDGPFWPTLTSDKKKHHWLKVDFERWQDEDESGEEGDDMNDMFSNMFSNKIGDFGDENEKDDSSSAEEEDLPDLE